MKLSILSAVVLSASVIAAPLTAGEVKSVAPKASTQGVVTALTQEQIALLAFGGLVVVGVIVDGGGSTSSTPGTTATE
jgi:hypothetical protein